MANKPVKLWVPSQELDALGKSMPLSNIDEVMGGRLVTAVLANPGYLGQIGKTHVLAHVGHFLNDDQKLTGAYGHINGHQNHTMYPKGLRELCKNSIWRYFSFIFIYDFHQKLAKK